MAKRADPSRLLDRAKRDAELKPEIERVFEQNLKVYGVRKVFAIGLERMATRCQTIRCTGKALMLRAVQSHV
jgi:hypothetical protein